MVATTEINFTGDAMSNKPVWNLTFQLTEYTPAEVEKMTGLSVTMQRDWRHRGFGPQFEKHARFDIIQVAELLFMKVCSDYGKGPAMSHVHARPVAFALVKNVLTYNKATWIGDPVAVFDAIPRGTRSLTENEKGDIFMLTDPKMESWRNSSPKEVERHVQRLDEGETEQYLKTPWLVDRLFEALGNAIEVSTSSNVIWWPNGELELGDYAHSIASPAAEPDAEGYLDSKFDGAAFVWPIDRVAERFAQNAPRPFVAVSVEVDNSISSVRLAATDTNKGTVTILRGKNDAGGKK